MIKVDRHPVTCDCRHCQAMFARDRFEPTWVYPDPGRGARRATGVVPIGHPQARPVAALWVTPEGRLATDWPGFPGTRGAAVEVAWDAPGGPIVTATRDPALAGLAAPVPLTHRAVERMNQRCMVDYQLAPPGAADFLACERHGETGVRALACAHVAHGADRVQAVVMYDPDGDFPDCLCTACFERYQQGDTSVVEPVCSRCQQVNLYRHELVGQGFYGQQ